MRRHRLGQPTGDRLGEAVGGGDDCRPAAAVRRDLERRHVGVSISERHDVADVRAAPLVDGLVVVADHTQLELGAGEQPDQALLGRWASWYSSIMRWRSSAWMRSCSLGRSKLGDGTDDQLAVGEQVVPLQRVEVRLQHVADRRRHRGRVELGRRPPSCPNRRRRRSGGGCRDGAPRRAHHPPTAARFHRFRSSSHHAERRHDTGVIPRHAVCVSSRTDHVRGPDGSAVARSSRVSSR